MVSGLKGISKDFGNTNHLVLLSFTSLKNALKKMLYGFFFQKTFDYNNIIKYTFCLLLQGNHTIFSISFKITFKIFLEG